MQEVGRGACRIVLVEDYPCENKDQLRRKEDEHIQLNRTNEMCLNINRAFITPEQKKEEAKVYGKEYRDAHREKGNAYSKAYYERKKAEKLLATL
jgi:hypothetical protein